MIKADPPKSFFELVGFNPTAVSKGAVQEVHGTTVLSIRYEGGVLTFADRRATMGNLIMVDSAEKVFSLDDHTVVAISGSFARSVEICRLLKHSFKFYRRMHLQEMSLDGKLQEISKALAANLSSAMSGVGMFLPIVASYDPRKKDFGVHSFDPAGARFETGDFAAAGSGSERIRGIFDYIVQEHGPWHERKREDVLKEGLRLLSIAADLDSATGGISKNLPLVRDLDDQGTHLVSTKDIEAAAKQTMTRRSKS